MECDVNTRKPGSEYVRLDNLVRRYERIFFVLTPVLAVLLSLLAVSILIIAQGASPLEAYKALVEGSFGSPYAIANTLNIATPLLLTGLGIALGVKAGVINLGGEGQIIMGGIFATLAATGLNINPPILHIFVSLLAGFAGGALWVFIPGFFYTKFGTNFMITTILLNDIAIGIISWLVNGPMVEPPGYTPQSALIADSAKLPIILAGTRLYPGILIAVLLAILSYVFIYKTPAGFDLRTVGENPLAAKFSGINVGRIQLLVILLAGGLAGLGGSMEILGSQYRLRSAFLNNYGYEALAVCMLGQKHPVGVVIAAILFGALKAGRGGMVRTANLPTSLSLVLSGIMIFFVTISPEFMKLPRYFAKKDMSRRLNAERLKEGSRS